MKSLYTWLQNPVGHDQYGTSGLTGLQLIIALALIIGTLIYCIKEDLKEKKKSFAEMNDE